MEKKNLLTPRKALLCLLCSIVIVIVRASFALGSTRAKSTKVKKGNKIIWWQDEGHLYVKLYADVGAKCKKVVITTSLQLLLGCRRGLEDRPVYKLNLREEIDADADVSQCKLAANKKYYSCSLVKKHSHFFDRLLAIPSDDGDDFYKFKISRNWEMWKDNDDHVTTAFYEHYSKEKEGKLLSFTEKYLKQMVVTMDIVIMYFNFPYSAKCLNGARAFAALYDSLDTVSTISYGWMNAIENIHFAKQFEISPDNCTVFIWRMDDNKTAPSTINIADDDQKTLSNRLLRYLKPAVEIIHNEKDLVKAYKGKQLTAIGFFDKSMNVQVQRDIDEFKAACIDFRDGVAQGERPSSIQPLNCAMALDHTALQLGKKYGVKHGVTYFRRHSQEILTYKFKKKEDAFNLTRWLMLHSTPLIARFDWGVRGDLLIRNTLPIGLLFLGKDVDRDPGDILGDESGGMNHGEEDSGFTSTAREYLGKMKFLWVGKSDFSGLLSSVWM